MMETANISNELTKSGEGRAYPWREDVRVPDPPSTAGTPVAIAAASPAGASPSFYKPPWYSADRRSFTNDCEEDAVQQGGGVAAQQAPAAAGPAQPAGAAVAGQAGAVNSTTRWASDAVNLAGKSDLQNRWSAPASAATPAGWGAPPGWSEAEHLFFLCSDYGIAQFFDDFQRERKYARMVEVLAFLHFTFAVLEAWAEKYHAPLGVLDVLVKALNVSSEGQKVRPPRGAAPHPASR